MKNRTPIALLLMASLLTSSVRSASAQDAAAFQSAIMSTLEANDASRAAQQNGFTLGELRKILAPIALYEDDVLANLVMATTYPDDLVEANVWAHSHIELIANGGDDLYTELENHSWNASVKAVATLPGLLQSMVKDINGTTAVLARIIRTQPEDMMNAIQELRFRANAAGLIATDRNVTVSIKNSVILISPNDRTKSYVPDYQVADVFGPTPQSDKPPVFQPPAASPLTFRGPLPISPLTSAPYWSYVWWNWQFYQIMAEGGLWHGDKTLITTPPSESISIVPFEYEDEPYRSFERAHEREQRRNYRHPR